MQSVTSRGWLHSPISWGAGGLILATLVALILGYLHYNPPGRDTLVTFYTDDAASLRVGDEVRMAGITVGNVASLSLERDQVKVSARVENDAVVGSESQIEVRLLTVVGGYYVNLISMGDFPLGSNTIPKERVRMPYNLVTALTDSTKITQAVAPQPIAESLDQIAQGLTGANVQVVSNVIEGGNQLMATIDRQRGQITKILDLSDEYIRALSGYREQFTHLVRQISLVTQTLVIYNTGVGTTIDGIGEVLLALKPVGDFYEGHRIEFITKMREYLHRGKLFVERNGLTIRALRRLKNVFDRILNAQNASPGLLATDLCVPVPGSGC